MPDTNKVRRTKSIEKTPSERPTIPQIKPGMGLRSGALVLLNLPMLFRPKMKGKMQRGRERKERKNPAAPVSKMAQRMKDT